MRVKELDFNLLSEIAEKHNLPARKVYQIYCDVDAIVVLSEVKDSVPEEQGYKGDIYSQEE